MQIVDFYPSQLLAVYECALYDLGTFLGHQDCIQRHQEIGDIMKVKKKNFFFIILIFY
jgi:hypothetical protein